MHVQHPVRAGPLVQVVDVLGDHEQVVAEPALEVGEGAVGGVRLDGRERRPAGVVEPVHEHRLVVEALGRGHLFDPVALPQTVGVPERRDPALRGDPGTREDDDARHRSAHSS